MSENPIPDAANAPSPSTPTMAAATSELVYQSRAFKVRRIPADVFGESDHSTLKIYTRAEDDFGVVHFEHATTLRSEGAERELFEELIDQLETPHLV